MGARPLDVVVRPFVGLWLLVERVPVPSELLVGRERSDDAAVYRIVDDPFDFGRIAATNALSDLYAMGTTPLFALAILGMPLDKLPPATISEILRGGAAACANAGIVVAGDHSIDSIEPIHGLAAIGLVDPALLKRNGGALPGNVLILVKPRVPHGRRC